MREPNRGFYEGPGPLLALLSPLSSARSREWHSVNPRHCNRPWALVRREDEKRCLGCSNQEGFLEETEVWRGEGKETSGVRLVP